MTLYNYALVDFFTDKTVHICEISELKHDDMSKLSPEKIIYWNKLEEAFILWRRSPTAEPERWPCHIIQLSEDRQPLIKTRQKIEMGLSLSNLPLIASEQELGKGKREKAKRSPLGPGETSFLEDAPVKAKKKKTKNAIQQKIMETIKETCSMEPILAARELTVEIERLKTEIKELEDDWKYEKRSRMKAERELKEWKEMHNVVQDLKSVMGDWKKNSGLVKEQKSMNPSPPEDTTSLNEACVSRSEQMDYTYLEKDLKIRSSLYNRINKSDYRKFTSELLMVVFGREMLATHSLNGRKAANSTHDVKEALPADQISAIIAHIQKSFNVTEGEVKSVVRAKLNNEDKMWRKRKEEGMNN